MMSHQPDRTDRIAEDESDHVVTEREGTACTATVTTDAVKPGSVEVNAGGGGPWQARAWREADANYPTDPDDPISGFPVLKALLRQMEEGMMWTPEPSPLASALAL